MHGSTGPYTGLDVMQCSEKDVFKLTQLLVQHSYQQLFLQALEFALSLL